jgi:hypothetical protein
VRIASRRFVDCWHLQEVRTDISPINRSGVTENIPTWKPKIRTEENVDTVQRQMEDEPQLSLGQLSQQTELTVSTCQRIVRKDHGDSVKAEKYWTNILDVFINQLHNDGSGVFSTRRSYSTGDSSLFVAIF